MAFGRKKKEVAPEAPPAVVEVVAELVKERAVPRYTAEGILLNPEDFHVGSDGVLTPKGV